jgi:adenylosuccinate synthase
MEINFVDIIHGLNWGDEAKGKITSCLAKTKKYNFVCRWAGGNNAGHTIYIDGKKYKTHLIPSGIFFEIKSIIGPDCVVNIKAFKEEIQYLKENGFDTSLIKISPRAHIISDKHVEEDQNKCSTSRGIAMCYRDKYARIGCQVKDEPFFKDYLWDEKLYGNILCEGAQGFWLDITKGNYPYVTSSTTLPYGACSLGFPPRLIRKIFGASKIYDTRVGPDTEFSEKLLEIAELKLIGEIGKEFGTSTGRIRKVNWLNLVKLIEAINISGTTDVIISKIDILEELKLFKLIHEDGLISFENLEEMKLYINDIINKNCRYVSNIIYSGNVEYIN